MSSLTSAHRGYEYQDLLVACRLVDLLVGDVVEVRVDQKQFPDDRFDDLTTVDIRGVRERVQFKHTDNDDRPLTVATFTNDKRRLRLDLLVASMVADRHLFGSTASGQLFRVVLRDLPPTDQRLASVLVPADPDPGPFLPNMRTVRLAFDPEALRAQTRHGGADDASPHGNPFAFLGEGSRSVDLDDLVWACRHLVIEVGAPAMSTDLTKPGLAEQLLLERALREVGAGVFPNEDRSPEDVAEALIRSARAGRLGSEVGYRGIVERARLRVDFGAVSRAHPVDPSVEVLRPVAVDGLAREAESLAQGAGVLLAVGPPGQGKSWLCHQLREELARRGWLAVEHYCYLGDAESDRDERVLAERVFGSLVGRLAEADPRLVEGQQPRFAADERALTDYIKRSLDSEPARRIALVVDGIDHITRVLGGRMGGSDPSRSLAEVFALMEIPSGTVLIVLSQPGGHLEPLEHMGATTVRVEGLDAAQLRSLTAKLGLIRDVGAKAGAAATPSVVDEASVEAFLDALAERSAGNALYATYLCRETLRHDAIVGDPAAAVGDLPPFDGTLEAYYDHLYSFLDAEGAAVADVIGFVDFAVTQSELCEIRPDTAHRIGPALEVLSPVLEKRAAQGGVRVYHESFGRYLRGRISDSPQARRALVEHVAGWLRCRGLFEDARAFHSLVPLLAAEGRDSEAVELVGRDFVVRSVAAGFPTSAILHNLAAVIRSAASLGDWPAVACYVELSRSAETYQTERFESSWVEFVDVPIALLGTSTVAERFVHEDRLVMSAKAGLKVCAAIDAHGGPAPWREYMTGYLREVQSSGISDADIRDEALSLAWLRGRLRLSAPTVAVEPESDDSRRSASRSVTSGTAGESSGSGGERRMHLSAPIDWHQEARWMEAHGLDPTAVAAAAFDTHGVESVVELVGHLDEPGPMILALAEHLADNQTGTDVGSPREWAIKAAENGLPPGSLHRIIALDVPVEDVIPVPTGQARQRLLELTRTVQEPSIVWENKTLWAWLDACLLAAHLDPLGLSATEGLIDGEGWYKCWLRFVIGLVRAEAAEDDSRHVEISEAFQCLTADMRPFAGDPRACDLYSIRNVISCTIKRALAMIDDQNCAQTLHLLREVGTSVETSLGGSINNPLPLDLLVEAAVGGSDTARAVTEELLEDVIANESADRHYPDLAELHLLAARLAVASNNLPKATDRWHSACALRSGYGWHKDITIFEVLNPVPALMEADPSRRRKLVARLQALCERAPRHTDHDETDHAWTQWWTLAGKADPAAAARLAGTRLLSRCHNPDWVRHGALEDLWASWREDADPLLAALLRLTLDTPLSAHDADVLSRLAEDAQQSGRPTDSLMIWLLARADERPVDYASSNSDEMLEADDHKIAGLDAAAKAAGLPGVIPIRDYLNGTSEHPDPPDRQSPTRPRAENAPPPSFAPGAKGLAQAIRAWQTRPYEPESDEWAVDRFANVIVSRLLEVAEEGRVDDAARALRPLARGFGSSDRVDLMQQIADGLEGSGHSALAAVTYTLGWTGATGGGIGRFFGGSAGIPALRQAIQLDAELTQRVIAEEIEHLIGTGYPTNGVSQALIHAFAVGAIKLPDRLSTDVAFEVWDEVFAVINDRAPVVHPSDEPHDPYESEVPCEETTQAQVDLAFALGTIASLSHVGRERKRRTLLAIRLLLEERPGLAAEAFQVALGALREPATLAWLLQLLLKIRTEPRMETVLAKCRHELSRHATGQFLVVRALARRLLGDDAPPMAPPSDPHPSLVATHTDSLWVPDTHSDAQPATDANADSFVQVMTKYRLRQAETVLPGLDDAVSARFAIAMNDDDRRHLLDRQRDAYADYGGERWPDAFLVPKQTVEEVLQETAAGGRAARAVAGAVVADPVVWEDQLADMLADDPAIPLAVEALRIPRPPTPAPSPPGATVWIEASASAASEHYDLRATLDVQPASNCWVADRGPYEGWRMIASAERRMYPHPEPRNHTEFCAVRHRAVEFRDSNDTTGLDRRPLTEGDIRWWRTHVAPLSQVPQPDAPVPVAALDHALAGAGDGPRLLGIPTPILAPVPPLIGLLNLRPAEWFALADPDGCGLVLVTWRSAYETPTNSIPRPRLVGSALMLRPDLFERLAKAAGGGLTQRDFVEGQPELANAV